MPEFEKIPEPKNKFTEFQKKYNLASKGTAKLLGTNIALFVCMLLPLLLVGFIWTDFGTPVVGTKFISEGIATVTLFVIGELLMVWIGSSGGKLDSDYIEARKEFDTIVNEVNRIGTALLNVFCDWQIDIELEHAVFTRLRSLYLTRSDWEKIKGLSYDELKAKYGRKKAKCIMAIHDLEPIELNEAILLFDNVTDGFARGGVPISGETYLHNRARSVKMILSAMFTGVLTVSIAITLTSDISWARVVYTAFKLIVLLYRMVVGYNRGAKAYNTVEVCQLKAKSNYLRQYKKFVVDKIFVKLGDKYGDIECYISDENCGEDLEEQAVIQDEKTTDK